MREDPPAQSELPGRYTASVLFREAFAQLGLERGFVRTFVDLLAHPGEMLRSSLRDGFKGRYLGPLPFLLLSSGAWWFAWLRFPPPFMPDLMSLEPVHPAFEFLLEYGALLSCLNIVPLSLGTWLVLRPMKLRFVEHLVANAYVWAMVTFLALLIHPLLFTAWALVVMGLVNLVGLFAYHPFAFSQLGDQGFPRGFPRAWVATVLGSTLLLVPLLVAIIFSEA